MKTRFFTYFFHLVVLGTMLGCEKDYNPVDDGQGDGTTPVDSMVYPEGAIQGVFYVSATKKVAFSKGNLRYQESTKKWRFAEEQWLTCDNSNRKADKTAWIDLFQWGNNTPYTNSYSHEFSELDANTDWGKHNKIENGGNQIGLWRTLTVEEWDYLNKNHRNGKVKIYTNPNSSYSETYHYYLPANWNGSSMPSTSISISEWKEYEAKGAMLMASFIPYYYYNSTTQGWTEYSNTLEYAYWSSSFVSEDYAYTAGGGEAYVSTPKSMCCAVRLVCDLN